MKDFCYVNDLDASYNSGAVDALEEVKSHIKDILGDLKNMGHDEPLGFSTLIGRIDDMIDDYESEE